MTDARAYRLHNPFSWQLLKPVMYCGHISPGSPEEPPEKERQHVRCAVQLPDSNDDLVQIGMAFEMQKLLDLKFCETSHVCLKRLIFRTEDSNCKSYIFQQCGWCDGISYIINPTGFHPYKSNRWRYEDNSGYFGCDNTGYFLGNKSKALTPPPLAVWGNRMNH